MVRIAGGVLWTLLEHTDHCVSKLIEKTNVAIIAIELLAI